MPCYIVYDQNRRPVGHICGDLGPHCSDCGAGANYLCDFPVGDGKTCDRHICGYHAHEVAPEVHYCDGHHAEWRVFVESGGVAEHLANVIAFKAEK